MGEQSDEEPKRSGQPGWFNGIISSGMAVTLAGALIWVGALGQRVAQLEQDGKDSNSLGTRITAVEVKLTDYGAQQDRVERKIDRLLEHRAGIPGGPTHADSPDQQ